MDNFKIKILATHWVNVVMIVIIWLFELIYFNRLESFNMASFFEVGMYIVLILVVIVVFFELLFMQSEKKSVEVSLLVGCSVLCCPFIYWTIKNPQTASINLFAISIIIIAYLIRRNKLLKFCN